MLSGSFDLGEKPKDDLLPENLHGILKICYPFNLYDLGFLAEEIRGKDIWVFIYINDWSSWQAGS